MKQCSKCHQTYPDDELNFCLSDGTPLVSLPDSSFEKTAILSSPFFEQTAQPPKQGINPLFSYSLIALLALAVGGGIVYLLRPGNEAPPISTTKIENSTPSPIQAPVTAQPTFDYATKNVRAGTADGKRLRVVVDLTRANSNTGNAARFETLTSGGANGEARVLIYAQNDNFPSVKYESKQARKLGTVYLSPSDKGLEVRVAPQRQLYLRDVFFIPQSSANPNDRVVIDLCFNEECPSLHP
jgi:hypothetical protein